MKNFVYVILFALFLQACASSKQFLQQGNYPAAIQSAVIKLQKNPKKADKHILALEKAWKIERNKILDRIEFLKLEGSPDSWAEIHDLYNKLNDYQKAIKPLLPLYIDSEFRNASIPLIDVNAALLDAKLNAANFSYAKGYELLAKENKHDARTAYAHFVKVKDYYPNFKDVDDKIKEAFYNGQNHVLLRYANASHMIIPQQFMSNISSIDVRNLKAKWITYHLNENEKHTYDYYIDVIVNDVQIGAEQVNSNRYIDKKVVEDGFQYVLDANGNVAKDSLGNDIKEPAYTEIIANVFETEQTKVGFLQGRVFYKDANGHTFRNIPFQENLVFKNYFAEFNGDPEALSDESKKKIGGRALPFPDDLTMVMDASELVKNKIFYILQINQQFIQD